LVCLPADVGCFRTAERPSAGHHDAPGTTHEFAQKLVELLRLDEHVALGTRVEYDHIDTPRWVILLRWPQVIRNFKIKLPGALVSPLGPCSWATLRVIICRRVQPVVSCTYESVLGVGWQKVAADPLVDRCDYLFC